MAIVEAVARHHDPGGRRSGSGFWVAGAVHVASALVADAPVDEDYLRSVGMLDKLPLWRSMMEPTADSTCSARMEAKSGRPSWASRGLCMR